MTDETPKQIEPTAPTAPTNQELADAVREAVTVLNRAVGNATKAGLIVGLDVRTHHTVPRNYYVVYAEISQRL